MKNYITPSGAQRLQRELRQLLHEERPKLVEVIAWAASNGDRSENGDYIYGKRRLREIDSRIRFLSHRLEQVQIVDPAKQSADRVLFGATVTVENDEGERKTYAIVGTDENEPARGKISFISPLGSVLLQRKKGELVTFRSPKDPDREIAYEVIEIEYKSID